MAVPNVMAEDFYKDLDPILDIVNINYVVMDDNMKTRNVRIILRVVDTILQGLKSRDEVFNQLYSQCVYVGSYYDGLRVAKPTEFDLNLIMQLPSNYQLQIDNTNVTPSFIKIRLLKTSNIFQRGNLERTIESWCDVGGFLLENNVRQWMESIISRYLGIGATRIAFTSGETVEVRVHKSGPAFTLNVKTGSDVIDVDLVFAFMFPETKQPPSSIRWNRDLAASWTAIPKKSNDPRFWRLSFTNSERKLVQNQYKLKLINRFLKALRDGLDLQISSYFIKTLFLWEAHECDAYNRARFWEKRQGYLFIHMLSKLYARLNEKRLPFYWHSNFNLFDELRQSQAINMANQIKHIISKINDLIIKKDNEQLKLYVLGLFKKTELSMANLRLIENRIILEKCKPIEQNLKYQVEKYIKSSIVGTVDDNNPSRFKANPEDLMKGSDEMIDQPSEKNKDKTKSGVYVPPKLTSVPYEDESSAYKQNKLLEHIYIIQGFLRFSKLKQIDYIVSTSEYLLFSYKC